MGLDESEWGNLHPHQVDSFFEVWKEKQKREDIRNALIQHIVAQSVGMKIKGRRVKVDDFLPDYAKPDHEEELMAEVARELAKQKK